MSFPRFCEYILSIEGALSSHEKRKPQLPPPETESECVCVCVCVFPPGAAAGPSPLCAWQGLQAAQSTSKQPPRRRDPRPAWTPPTQGFLFASFSGGGSRVALPVNKNLIKPGPMPEKQPKETEVQGGKLGRRPVGGARG